MIRNSGKKLYWVLLNLSMTSILACQSTPQTNEEISLSDPTVRCIGLGREPAGGLIARCNLDTWVDVPVRLDATRRVSITIDDKTRLIPCVPNQKSIGIVDGLIIKCRKNQVRLYWKRVGPSFQDYTFEVSESVVIINDGAQAKKFILSGISGSPSVLWPIDSIGPTDSKADMLINDVVNDFSE